VEECSKLENNLDLHVGVDDGCRWSVVLGKGYIANVYHMSTSQKLITHIVSNDTIWNKLVSLKVSRFDWWLL